MFRYLAWGLLWAVTASAQPTATDIAPIRPTAQDVSFKVQGGNKYFCFRGKAATNTERDAMEETLFGIFMPAVRLYAASMPSCKQNMGFIDSQLATIGHRLAAVHQYDDILGPPRKTWEVTDTGRHYQIEYAVMKRVRDCSLSSNAKKACAENPLMTPDLLDLLDMQKKDGVCVTGATFTAPPDCTKEAGYDTHRRSLGIASGKVFFPPLTGATLEALHKTHQAHKAVSDWRCGEGAEQPAGSVRDAHIAYEGLARTENERHFFRMVDFSGAVHPSWSKEEVCHWARIQDRYHECWMKAQEEGDWGKARRCDKPHQFAHLCMNYGKGVAIDFRFAQGFDVLMDDVPITTCEAYLAVQFPPAPTPGPVPPAGNQPGGM